VGPYEAQRLQQRHAATLDAAVDQCGSLSWCEAANTAPLVDVFAGTHDRLYTRLFQS
jgi:urease accessory protein UreF